MNSEQNNYSRKNIIVDSDVFKRAKNKRFKGSKIVYIGIPVSAYRYEVKTNAFQDDFLRTAVTNLKNYYIKQGNPNCVQDISKDLGLSATLIKAILKENEQNLSQIEEDNHQRRTISSSDFIVLFDRISGSFVPLVLPMEQYESLKDDCDDLSAYRTSIGDSKKYFIHALAVPSDCNKAPLSPNQAEVSTLLRQRALKHEKLKNGEMFNLIYTGVCEEFFLISAVYYDKNNAVDYCAENPFNSGRASWIVRDIEEYINNRYPHAEKLQTSLEDMRDSVDISSGITAEQHDSLWLGCMDELERIYGKEELNQHGELKDRLISAIVEYSKMVHFCQSEESEEVLSRLEESKQRYYISVSNLIEKIIASAFLNNYEELKRKDYTEYIKQIENDNYCLSDYRRLANEIGFDEEQISMKVRLRKRSIDYVIKNQEENADLNVLIFCCLVQAKYNSQHPFYELSKKYPDLFEYLHDLEKLRNPSKHGSYDDVQWNCKDFKTLAVFLFNLLIQRPKNQVSDIDIGRLANRENIEEDYQRLDTISEASIRKYTHLCMNPAIHDRALALERALNTKGSEYYSKAYNLLDEVIKQITICIKGNDNQIDRELLDIVFESKYDRDDIARTSENIIRQYGIQYSFKGRYNDKNFARSVYSSQLSFGNKVYYFIILADKKVPSFFKRLLSENEQLFSVVEKITDSETGRGHSNIADFDKADIPSLHFELLKICENIATYIEEFEEESE